MMARLVLELRTRRNRESRNYTDCWFLVAATVICCFKSMGGMCCHEQQACLAMVFGCFCNRSMGTRSALGWSCHSDGPQANSDTMTSQAVRPDAQGVEDMVDYYEGNVEPHDWPDWVAGVGNPERSPAAQRPTGAMKAMETVIRCVVGQPPKGPRWQPGRNADLRRHCPSPTLAVCGKTIGSDTDLVFPREGRVVHRTCFSESMRTVSLESSARPLSRTTSPSKTRIRRPGSKARRTSKVAQDLALSRLQPED